MFNIGDDNELDKLSREAAGKYMHPVNSDWDAISAELDKVMPAEEKKRKPVILWWLLPVLLIGSGAAYWMISDINSRNNPANTIITNQKQHTASEKSMAPDLSQKENTANTEKPATNTNTVTTHTESVTEKGTNQKAVLHPGISGFSLRSGTADNIHSVQTGKTNKTVIAEASDKASVNNTSSEIAMPPVLKQEDATENTTNLNIVDQPAAAKETETKTIVADKSTDTTPSKPVSTSGLGDEVAMSILKNKKQPARRGKGFSYELIAGVDESTVKFTYGKNPGYNLGIVGGYHFNDQLSIHTGAIYTQKNYKLAGADFTAPKGTQISYYKLETVEGYCRMWEVPLFLRYTVSESPKHSFFLSTGLSSYFMTSEDYNFFYYYNNTPVTRNNAYNSSDTHVLSILSLSAGFENRISNNWSLNIEPYAKIPLGGIGLGNIRLSSFGLNFSVQYRQPAKK